MTDEQLKQMQKLLDDIIGDIARLHTMLAEVKEPGSQLPSPFSGGGPGPR